MIYSELVLAAGSGKVLTRSLLDKNNQPIDFTVGTWRADLAIIEYPEPDSPVFARLSTATEVGSLRWLSLNSSSVIITPDPTVTLGWDFYKYHYDLFLKGPNVQSAQELVAHGPFRLDR